MSSMHTPASLLSHIKRRARVVRKTEGVRHAVALDRACVENGFHNFKHALSLLVPAPAGAAERFPLRITQAWRDRESGDRGYEAITVSLTRPWDQILQPAQLQNARYLRAFGVDSSTNGLAGLHLRESQESARHMLCGAARTLTFADVTRLRPSTGFSRAYPAARRMSRSLSRDLDPRRLPGQDHVGIWFDPATRRYLLVDEPYENKVAHREDERQRWCEHFEYAIAKPAWAGMYAPGIGSQIYLLSSAKKGLPLEPLVRALDALPQPVTEQHWRGESKIVLLGKKSAPDVTGL